MGKNNKIFRSLIGSKYNRLTIVSEPYSEFSSNKKRRFVDCVCECGANRKVLLNSIMSGHSQSCGCVKLKYEERLKASKMRSVFQAMHHRCENKNNSHYDRYGGRGISVCKEWALFADFYNDMKDTWQLGLELDRENNDLGYYKNNCRWVTNLVQQRNRSDVVFNESLILEIRKSELSQNNLARIYKVNQSTISRIKNNKRWIMD